VRYGADGLHPKHRRGRPGRPPELDAAVERRVLAEALAQPAWGPLRLSDQLAMRGIRVAPSTIYRALRRNGLGTRQQRFALIEQHSASRAGLLTERTRRALEKARPTASQRHVEAKRPGDLVCFDCFYIGNLKGVGRVWQITACDAASSYALAEVFLGEPRGAVSAPFLRRVTARFQEAGWPVKRVLTDRGSEFKGAFDQACHDLGVRHTRTKPRHAFTNGFVERLQGTILHEHWRIEFRRRYFTRIPQLERSLQGLPSPLQPRAAAPRLPDPRKNACADRVGSNRCESLTCTDLSGTGQTRGLTRALPWSRPSASLRARPGRGAR
jgi:IS30 family transposase